METTNNLRGSNVSLCAPIHELLEDAKSRLEEISDSPMLDAQLLLATSLGCGREWLIAHGNTRPDSKAVFKFQKFLSRRLSGEPIAYILGVKGFWSREFLVAPGVLVPRPETELLVETLLSQLGLTKKVVIDVGTGSGAIAISVAAERPEWIVTGIDKSPEAIQLATKNSAGLTNVNMFVGNWCEAINSGSVDAIVSNPPYIRDNHPSLSKLTYEPPKALKSGSDGLNAIRAIIPAAHCCLKSEGLLLIEHGYDQQKSVIEIYRKMGFRKVTGLYDLNNLPRAVIGYRQ